MTSEFKPKDQIRAKLARIRQQVADLEVELLLAEQNTEIYEHLQRLKQGREDLKQELARSRRQQESLRKLQDFFKRVISLLPFQIQVYDLKKQQYIYENTQGANFLGYSVEQMQGMGSWFIETVTHPEDYDPFCEYLAGMGQAADGEVVEHQYRMRSAEGQWRWLLSRGVVFQRDSQGVPSRILCAVSDVSGQKQVTRSQDGLSRTFEQAFSHLPQAAAILDPELQVLFSNKQFQVLSGYNQSELADMKISGLFLGEEPIRPEDHQAPGAAPPTATMQPMPELRLARKDGEIIRVNLEFSPIDGDPLVPARWLAVMQQADQAPAGPETGERKPGYSPDPALITLDSKGSIDTWSQGATALYGYSAQEAKGQPLHLLSAQKDARFWDDLWQNLQSQGQVTLDQVRHMRKDQSELEVAVTAVALENRAGQKTGAALVVREIGKSRPTAGKPATYSALEHALNEIYQAFVSNSDLAVVAQAVMDQAKALTSSHFGFVGNLNDSPDRLMCPAIDREVWDVCQIEDKQAAIHKFGGMLTWVLKNQQPLLTNDAAADPRSAGIPEGHVPINKLLSVPVKHGQEVLGQIAVAAPERDYSPEDQMTLERLADLYGTALVEHRRREQAARIDVQIQQAQKMEAIGAMAEGIANDFNNLLQSINGYAEILLLGKEENDPQYSELKEIIRAATRATTLIRQLLAFSRKFESNLRPVDLNHQVRKLKGSLFKLIPEVAPAGTKIDIDLHLADDLYKISADPVQMEQLLINLAVNSLEACSDGCRLKVTSKNVTLDEEFCRLHLGAKPGDYVLLSLNDNGRGMDKA
ncbi:MAG: PAS domain S-box protein, partial [Desulfarculaceae bacterium]